MPVLIDTNIFIAARNADDENHERAKTLIREALQGKFGKAYTSDHIFDEAVTVAFVRTKRVEFAVDMGKFILSTPRIHKIAINAEIFESAWAIFQKYCGKIASFTDCSNVAVMKAKNIEYLLSFDTEFDGLISRVF